jgi:nucleoside-diphosphate-sugar epimerase
MGSALGRRTRRVPIPDFIVDLAAAVSDEIMGMLGRAPVFSRDKARELKARLWLCSAARAEAELSWRPLVALDDGILETVDWYRRNGLLSRRD